MTSRTRRALTRSRINLRAPSRHHFPEDSPQRAEIDEIYAVNMNRAKR